MSTPHSIVMSRAIGAPTPGLLRDLGAAGIVAALALGEAAQVYLGLSLQSGEVTWAQALRLTLPSWVMMLALTIPVLRLLDRVPPGRFTLRRLAGYSLGALVFSASHLAGSALMWSWLGTAPEGFGTLFSRLATLYFMADVLAFAAVASIHALVRGYGAERRRQVAAAELRADDARARLRTLRGRLRPDFFFNTMNAAAGLVARNETQRGVEVLSALSTLLRASLGRDRGRDWRLDEETQLVSAYLGIQQIRFPDRVRGTCVRNAGAGGCVLPPLLLVELVESVVDSGLESGAPLEVELVATRQEAALVVQIRHTGSRLSLPQEEASRIAAWVRRFDPGGSLSVDPCLLTLRLQARSPRGAYATDEMEVAS